MDKRTTIEDIENAHDQLDQFAESRLSKHTVVLMNDSMAMGTGLLIKWKSKKYIVTAAHVAEQIFKKSKKAAIIIQPDEIQRELSLEEASFFNFQNWDPDFKSTDLQEDLLNIKDLAIMEVPVHLQSIIDAVKEYVNFQPGQVENLDFSKSYVAFGALKKNEIKHLMPLAFTLHEKKENGGRDYYIAHAMKTVFPETMENYPSITDFHGCSGCGLFLPDGKNMFLVGIAFFQNQENLSAKNGFTEVYFYGPKSIEKFLSECAN